MRTFGNSLSGPLVVILSSILFSWSHLHGLSVVDFVVSLKELFGSFVIRFFNE
ncbi:TPA: hypothetical protein ACG2B6_001866 [Streptococcus agalactiae]